MKRFFQYLFLTAILCVSFPNIHAATVEIDSVPDTQWKGKRVGILGDSMSVPTNNPERKRFYTYLAETLGITPLVYAKSGYQWKDLEGYAKRMKEDHGDNIDAIFIWAGTNDYNASRPIGVFFTEQEENVNVNCSMVKRNHRSHVMADSTFCGSINKVMAYLKENYPTQQIIILTPIHRGFAQFGPDNIQPDEQYANKEGAYIDDYVETLKGAGEVWSVPVIDLFSISGLYPLYDSHNMYIQNETTDRLHPDKNGHKRLAETLRYQLMALPANF